MLLLIKPLHLCSELGAIAGADIVVSVVGTHMHKMAFARPGADILVLGSSAQNVYRAITKMLTAFARPDVHTLVLRSYDQNVIVIT